MRKPWLVYSVIFTVLVVLFLLYHLKYVPSRKAALASRYLRILATTAGEVKSELLGAVAPLTNTVTRALRSEITRTNLTEQLTKQVSQLRHVDSVREARVTSTSAAPTLVTFTVRDDVEPPAWELESQYQFDATNLLLRTRLAVDATIRPLLNRKEFDDVLILDKDGKVIFQRGGAELRVLKLRVSVPEGIGTFQTNWVAGSGATFVLLGQPLRFTLPLSDKPNEWTLCGLVAAERYESQSSEISFTWLIGLCSLVLLLILLWPILDVGAMPTTTENLRGFDLFSLVFSMLLGIWVATFVFLLFVSYNEMEDRFDRDLRAIAERISENFREELARVVSQLKHFDANPNREHVKTNIYTDPLLFSHSGLLAPNSYPFFEMVFWVKSESNSKSNGQQTAKWTRKGETTPFINVADRTYFQRVAQNRTWPITIGRSTTGISIEPIYSRNTGENMSVIAIKSQDGNVAAIDVNFLSLNDTLLPADFGFCIIDSDGQVLFHSDKSRNLRENFLIECNYNPRLTALMRNRSTDRFDLIYAGHEHSVFVMPVADLPWTLIAFRNERPLQTGNLVVGTIALAYWLVGLGVALVVLLLLFRFGRHWIWPNPKWSRGYQTVLVFNILVATGLVIWARSFFSGSNLPAAVAFISILAVLILFLLRVVPKESSERKQPTRLYVLSYGSMVFLISGVPAIVSFQCVFRSEVELLAKKTQLQLALSTASRMERLSTKYAVIEGSSNVIRAHIETSWREYFHCPNTLNTRVGSHQITSGATKRTSTPYGFARIRCLYHGLENDSLVYVPNRAHDGVWQWTQPVFGQLNLDVEGFGSTRTPGAKALTIQSTIPSLPINPLWLILTGGLGFLLSCAAVWFIATQVLLLNIAPYQAEPGETQGLDQAWADPIKRRVLYQVARTGFVNPRLPQTSDLLASGLLVRDPVLRVADENLRKVILAKYGAEPEPPAAATPQSHWRVIKGPLIFILLLVGLYYFATQQPMWDNSLTLLTGFAGMITAMVNVMKLLAEKTRQSPPPPAKTT